MNITEQKERIAQTWEALRVTLTGAGPLSAAQLALYEAWEREQVRLYLMVEHGYQGGAA